MLKTSYQIVDSTLKGEPDGFRSDFVVKKNMNFWGFETFLPSDTIVIIIIIIQKNSKCFWKYESYMGLWRGFYKVKV